MKLQPNFVGAGVPPELPPLPKPVPETITFTKGTLVIIILLAGILITLTMYFASRPDPKDLTVYCQKYPASPTLTNNIQASHAYTGQISNRDTLTCIKADDHGIVYGSSMQPTFFEGNTIMLKNYTDDMTIHTGDLVRYFRYNNNYPNCTRLREQIANNSLGGAWVNNSMAVIHRVNAVYDQDIITQGDNLYEQEHIEACQITHIAVGIIFT